MAEKPEEHARAEIDRFHFAVAGWLQSANEAKIRAESGVAIRELPTLKPARALPTFAAKYQPTSDAAPGQ